jgi:predicted DNA-binding transcriptional regulator YafY
MNNRVKIDYCNYRGERSVRLIEPRAIRFGSNEWHPEPQWLLEALDVEKVAERTFAMKDIAAWTPVAPATGA